MPPYGVRRGGTRANSAAAPLSIIVQIAWAIAFAWLLGAALTLAALARLKFLKPTDEARLKSEDAPLVSILLPARNEERRVLADCVRSLLAQDYASFEVVAVDDRSTDATLRLLRSLAEEDSRLRVIAGGELPDGWLGKPNALRQALEAARGSWVLTADADVIFHPSALRTAMTYARSHGCDAVSLFPHFETRTFWERVFTPTWVWGMLVFFPLDLVNRRRSVRLAIGMGAFFLMRREALACAAMLTSALAVTTGRGVTWKGRRIYGRAGGLRPPRA